MTSVRRQIYLSKVAVDRWVVICGSSLVEKVGRREETGVGRMPPPILTIILAALSAFNIAVYIADWLGSRGRYFGTCNQK